MAASQMAGMILNSARWSAYGDALGFIGELADSAGLRHRMGSVDIRNTVPWRRRIGGRFGVEVMLPAGCYSDDTQLRLSTSRAIRGDGHFDVEALARVELPVWQAYALGAGTGTKAAARNLTNPSTNWFSNFFTHQNARYIDGGGNGAAMRIQPHVWAARDRSKPETFVGDVIRNAIITHGHPRGILGAVFHALCLASSLQNRSIPDPHRWQNFANCVDLVMTTIYRDSELSTFWLPTWNERSKVSFEDLAKEVCNECIADLNTVDRFLSDSPEKSYASMVESIGGLRRETAGSGTKTAIIATALAWMAQNANPIRAIRLAANLLESDTDTIASMTGALLGAVSTELVPGEVLDIAYIDSESRRLHAVSTDDATRSFDYPELGSWVPPRTQLDAVVQIEGQLVVAGLGIAEPGSEEFRAKDGDSSWQWMRLEFGQSILSKRRNVLRTITRRESNGDHRQLPQHGQQLSLNSELRPSAHRPRKAKILRSVDELTQEAIKAGFDPLLIGSHILELSEADAGIELAIAYASIIAKAKAARRKQR
jgi:ADP-ribosylglycohydrolase